MKRVETICKQAYIFGDKNTRHQARELLFMYNDNYRLYQDRIVRDTWTIDEYREYLDKHHIEYVEIELTKDNGKNIHMIIPSLMFKNMTSKDINKLLHV
ncbi:MAG: hypothetical protein J6A59_02240 [Lachnospiraceae bacterium]|nr:hypothetical protein [Lachnospiraceae bacterium]